MTIRKAQATNNTRNVFLVALFIRVPVARLTQQDFSATKRVRSQPHLRPPLGSHVPTHLSLTRCSLLRSSFSPVVRPVSYRTRPCSAWLPPTSRPRPNPAPCRTGTSSRPASRGAWSSLCRSDTCSSARCPEPRARAPAPTRRGASPLPSERTSPGRACLFLGNQSQEGAPVAGG